MVALLKERTITGKVVIFVQSKRSCQQLADRLKQMRHLEVRWLVGGGSWLDHWCAIGGRQGNQVRAMSGSHPY